MSLDPRRVASFLFQYNYYSSGLDAGGSRQAAAADRAYGDKLASHLSAQAEASQADASRADASRAKAPQASAPVTPPPAPASPNTFKAISPLVEKPTARGPKVEAERELTEAVAGGPAPTRR